MMVTFHSFLTLISIEILIICMTCSSSSLLNSKDFCKLAEKECTFYTNGPYIYQCGRSVCTRSEAACKEYLKVEKKVKTNQLIGFIDAKLARRRYNELRSDVEFRKFHSKLAKCPQRSLHGWQPNDVCTRERNCFQNQADFLKTVTFFQLRKYSFQISCSCPKNKPFVCGNAEKSFCSLSKQVCDSFSYATSENRITTAWIQLFGINKCDAVFVFN